MTYKFGFLVGKNSKTQNFFCFYLLKEQLQKLAGHMEFMKIVHMGVNNPHLKPKPGGYFSNAGTSSAAAAAVVSAVQTAASTVGAAASTPSESTSSSLLQRQRTALEPAVIHYDYETDVLLSNRQTGAIQPSSLGVVVDDTALIDDSPTAELLPSSGQEKL